MAKDLGISRQLMRAYELGLCVPGDDAKERIAKYYGQTVGFLFFGEGQFKPNSKKTRTVK